VFSTGNNHALFIDLNLITSYTISGTYSPGAFGTEAFGKKKF
jgi:hypothetical protein